MTIWNKPTIPSTAWSSPTGHSAIWNTTASSHSPWNIVQSLVFLCAESGDILETEATDPIILENQIQVDWQVQGTHSTIWT